MAKQAKLFQHDTAEYDKELLDLQLEADASAVQAGRKSKKVTLTGRPAMSNPKYQNIVREPFVSEGLVLEVMGSMGLHLCLGIRKDAYDSFESYVFMIDRDILEWLTSDSSVIDKVPIAKEMNRILTELHDARRDRSALAAVIDVTLPTSKAVLERHVAEIEHEADNTGLSHVLRLSQKGTYPKLKKCDDNFEGLDLQKRHRDLLKVSSTIMLQSLSQAAPHAAAAASQLISVAGCAPRCCCLTAYRTDGSY
jgi:hypothetical protein